MKRTGFLWALTLLFLLLLPLPDFGEEAPQIFRLPALPAPQRRMSVVYPDIYYFLLSPPKTDERVDCERLPEFERAWVDVNSNSVRERGEFLPLLFKGKFFPSPSSSCTVSLLSCSKCHSLSSYSNQYLYRKTLLERNFWLRKTPLPKETAERRATAFSILLLHDIRTGTRLLAGYSPDAGTGRFSGKTVLCFTCHGPGKLVLKRRTVRGKRKYYWSVSTGGKTYFLYKKPPSASPNATVPPLREAIHSLHLKLGAKCKDCHTTPSPANLDCLACHSKNTTPQPSCYECHNFPFAVSPDNYYKPFLANLSCATCHGEIHNCSTLEKFEDCSLCHEVDSSTSLPFFCSKVVYKGETLNSRERAVEYMHLKFRESLEKVSRETSHHQSMPVSSSSED